MSTTDVMDLDEDLSIHRDLPVEPPSILSTFIQTLARNTSAEKPIYGLPKTTLMAWELHAIHATNIAPLIKKNNSVGAHAPQIIEVLVVR